MTVRAATVTTLRNVGDSIKTFVAYHHAIGIEHIFLYFDDPNEPTLAWAREQKGVTAIPHDSKLRQAWASLDGFMENMNHLDREVMSRQVMNVEHAMRLARSMGLDWLLHIDADELFYVPNGDAADHFEWLTHKTPFDTVTYPNYEAVPETEESEDFFTRVTLFKKATTMSRPLTAVSEALIENTPQLRPRFFHYYDNGKAAVRLSTPGMFPKGVHNFLRAEPFSMGKSPEQCILHYACCGFDTLWDKYVTLGPFGDKWWGKFDIRELEMEFHLEARDVVMSGDREAARKFYRERLMINDPVLIAELEHHDLVTRISRPREVLAGLR